VKKIYNISVTLRSALHINGGTAPDRHRVTIKSNNKAYIPATLFKGMVRENFEKLINILSEDEKYKNLKMNKCTGKAKANEPCSCPVCTMFGKAGFQLSRIYFDNLETSQEITYSTRANVAIDRFLLKARNKALVFSETVNPKDKKNNPVVFNGQITAWVPEQYGNEILVCLTDAIKMIKTIGLGKSRGLGFVEVSIYEAKS